MRFRYACGPAMRLRPPTPRPKVWDLHSHHAVYLTGAVKLGNDCTRLGGSGDPVPHPTPRPRGLKAHHGTLCWALEEHGEDEVLTTDYYYC